VAAVFLIALGAGILIVGNGGGGPHEERALLAFLAIGSGLGLLRFALPATLLGTRRLARLTRQLTGDWCGVPIAESYASPPAGKLTCTERLRWLATDPATRRDLRWTAANLLVCALAAAPVAIIATGLVEFIGPEFTRLIPPPAFPGNTPSQATWRFVCGFGVTAPETVNKAASHDARHA
jgi:Putative sensor